MLKHFQGGVSYHDIMHKIPWNVLNKMLMDASYYEYDDVQNSDSNASKLPKNEVIELTDENADELINIMRGKAKLK